MLYDLTLKLEDRYGATHRVDREYLHNKLREFADSLTKEINETDSHVGLHFRVIGSIVERKDDYVPQCPMCKLNNRVKLEASSWQCERCDTSFIPA